MSLPYQMRLLQIVAPGRADWHESPVPKPGPGDVIVRIRAIATCPHWDLHIFGGQPMFPGTPLNYPYLPGEPGHEAVGEMRARLKPRRAPHPCARCPHLAASA